MSSRRSRPRKPPEFRLETLETRVLFSADSPLALSGALPPPAPDIQQVVSAASAKDAAITHAANAGLAAAAAPNELVIIDAGVPDLEALLADFERRGDAAPRVLVLDPSDDPLGRLGEILKGERGLSALHLISHGSDGELELGGKRITVLDLLARAGDVVGWRSAFADGADLLLYGCDVAASDDGRRFVDTLARLSGADVAASVDVTGARALGGDWNLEYVRGSVGSDVAVSEKLRTNYQESFATYTVSNLNDSGSGSLRQAIFDSNSSGSSDIIRFTVTGGIALASVLPDVTDTVLIDGTTAPFYFGFPGVFLNGGAIGGSAIDGIRLASGSDGSAVKGLSITNFTGSGIHIIDSDANTIQSNIVNTNGDGIRLTNVTDSLIGGTASGEGNTILGNAGHGIGVTGASASGNALLGNAISGNSALGIDLRLDGVTANDTALLDADSGPNGLQNTPDLIRVGTDESSTIEILGSLDSEASANYRIEFFASAWADGSGYGEAERYLGSVSITTDSGGMASVSTTLTGGLPEGEFITATATRDLGLGSYGDSSEFAANVVARELNVSPVITSSSNISSPENSTAAGNVTATDGNSDTLSYAITGGDDASLFSVGVTTGNLTFDSAPDFETFADADLDGIYEITVRVTDEYGAASDQAILVTVTNVDEPSVISGTFVGAANEGNIGDAPATASGALSISDPDVGDTPSFADVGSTNGDNSYGTFALVSGTWTYTLDQSAVQDLDAGDSVTDTITYTATDSSTQQITVTITGADDASVISGTVAGAVTEGNIGDAPETASGTIAISDVDGDDAPSFADVATTNGDNSYGTFALVSGTWTYTLDQSAVQDLDAGDSVTDTITYTASDSSSQQITVTITGTDDASVISGTVTGAVTEGNVGDAPETATGTIAISDVDGDDAPSFADVATTNGDNSYGTFALVSGTWTYTLDQSAVQYLDAGDSVTDTITYTATDSSSQQITVTITGTDDASVISGTVAGAVTEGNVGDAPVTATGTIAISDVGGDGAPIFADVASTIGDNSYGSFVLSSGTWTYTLDQSAVQYLDVGETVTDTTTYTSSDTSTQQITVTITGSDDASVITGTVVGAVTEGNVGDAPETASGTIAISDMDGDDSPSFADVETTNGDSSYGTFELTGGTWTYTLDQSAVQNLDAGDSVTDTITYTATDSSTQQITVTITGSDDAPVIISAATVSVPENTSAVLTLTHADVDADADNSATYSISGGADQAAFALDKNTGELSFLSAPDYESRESYDVEVSVGDGVSIGRQEIRVTVDDVDEAPEARDDTLRTEEDAVRSINVATELLANDSDPEGAALRLVNVTEPAHGTLVVVADGTLEYRPDADFNGVDRFEYRLEDTIGQQVTASAIIEVAPVNDPPVIAPSRPDSPVRPDFIDGPAISVGWTSIEENVVRTLHVEATDADGQQIVFALGGPDAALFEIDPMTGDLWSLAPLDFESPRDANGDNRYDLEFILSDGTGGVSRVAFSIVAADVNEAPSITAGRFAVSEGYVGQVGQLSASDPDEGDRLAFELLGAEGDRPGRGFSLLADGRLLSADPLVGLHVFDVRVVDAAGLSAVGRLTITVDAADTDAGEPPLGAAVPLTLAESVRLGEQNPDDIEPTMALSGEMESDRESTSAGSPDMLTLAEPARLAKVVAGQRFGQVEAVLDRATQRLVGEISADRTPRQPVVLPPLDSRLSFPMSASVRDAIESLSRQMDELESLAAAHQRIVFTAATAAGVTFSIGAAYWLLQSRLLLAAAMAAMPLWRPLDSVAILIYSDDRPREDDQYNPEDEPAEPPDGASDRDTGA